MATHKQQPGSVFIQRTPDESLYYLGDIVSVEPITVVSGRKLPAVEWIAPPEFAVTCTSVKFNISAMMAQLQLGRHLWPWWAVLLTLIIAGVAVICQ